MQWVALRPATGEHFECFAAPRHPLPSTPAHLDVAASTLLTGKTLATLLERWQNFMRTDDIICSWDRYATSLFLSSGGTLPSRRFDLRVVAKAELKRNIGTMEEFYASIAAGPSESFAPGRAGVRLGQLARIAGYFAGNGATTIGAAA